jgi:hypothetical protein
MWEEAKNRLNPQSLYECCANRAIRATTLGSKIIRKSWEREGHAELVNC